MPAGNCGGTFHLDESDPSKEITSPNFPNAPDRNTECVWTIVAPPGEAVQLEFEDMNMLGSGSGSG